MAVTLEARREVILAEARSIGSASFVALTASAERARPKTRTYLEMLTQSRVQFVSLRESAAKVRFDADTYYRDLAAAFHARRIVPDDEASEFEPETS